MSQTVTSKSATPALTSWAEAEAGIRQLLASGREKTALDRAKELHKTQQSAASEALVLDAYIARIRSLSRQNLHLEAKSLLDLVRQRYPSAASRLNDAADSAAARAGELDELLRPLADPALAPDRRTSIERLIEENVFDLRVVAECNALPPDHPLRRAALALQQAFDAVTSGPVAEEALALSEVSHRSPLAPWKLLVRAIACFYRGEDDACRRYLDAIRTTSMPAQLVPVIRQILDGGNMKQAGAAGQLVESVTGGSSGLRRSFEQLDQSFRNTSDNRRIAESIRTAVRECTANAPDLAPRLRQHIHVRCAVLGLDSDRMLPAIGIPAREDAYFLRLYARGLEATGDPEDIVMACTTWDEFRTAAIQEGWFRPNGIEVATLYVHMAGLLRRLPFGFLDRHMAEAFPKSKKKAGGENPYYLQPNKLYERAAALDPHSETFAQWLDWAKGARFWQAEQIVKAWNKVLPDDIEPILYLMSGSERSGAFATALEYLDKAERVDGLHTDVRNARLRLLARNAMSQIRRKKTALADRTLNAIAALPQAQQGDRPALLAALRYVAAAGDPAAAATHREESERLLGSRAAASILISGIAASCRRSDAAKPGSPEKLSPDEQKALPVAVARAAVLAEDVRLDLRVPGKFLATILRQFPQVRHSLDAGQLRALAQVALESRKTDLAYTVSAAGLERGGADEVRFLLLRARVLPERDFIRRAICAAAAAELARNARNMELVSEALDFLRIRLATEAPSVTPESAAEVLRREKAAPAPPKGNNRGPDYDDLFPKRECQCPECRRARGEYVDPFDEDDEDDDEEEIFSELPVPPDMPPEIARMLFEEMKDAMQRGESLEELIARLTGGGPPPRRKQKGRRK